MKAYLVFIAALTSVYDTIIISDMVRKGYTISLAYPEAPLALKSSGNLSVVITLKIETTSKTVKDIHSDITKILDANKMMVHAVIVTEYCGATWSASNIVVEKPAPETPIPPKSDKKNVN